MDDRDVVDDVNALLNLGVGDAYRLEHIKQAYIQNKSIWNVDKNYLQKMVDKYLIKHSNLESEPTETEEDSENEEKIHCWKCGKKSALGANFCMVCGASLFDVATESKVVEEPIQHNQKNNTGTIKLKIPIMIGIPIIILAIIGGAYSQGYFDSVFEKNELQETKIVDVKPSIEKSTEKTTSSEDTTSSDDANSKCGPGTVFDSKTNACVLDSKTSTTEKTTSSDDANSKCGPGTVFDSKTNACVLDK